MSTAREDYIGVLLPNGQVLVAGGWNDIPGTAFSSAELYDPSTGTWQLTGSISTGRVSHTATLLPDGHVLVVGGHDASGTPLSSAEIYAQPTAN